MRHQTIHAIFAPGVGLVHGTLRPSRDECERLLADRRCDGNDLEQFDGEHVAPYNPGELMRQELQKLGAEQTGMCGIGHWTRLETYRMKDSAGEWAEVILKVDTRRDGLQHLTLYHPFAKGGDPAMALARLRESLA